MLRKQENVEVDDDEEKALQVMMESAMLNVQKDKRESRSFGSLEKRAHVERSSKRMAFT